MIRRAAYRADKESIIRMAYKELMPFTRRSFPGRRFSRKEILYRLRNRHVFVKVGRNGSLCGFIMMLESKDRLFIDLLAVDKQYQGQGAGTSLMYTAEHFGIRRGLRTFTLYVDDSNDKAIRFYERLGYRRIGYEPQVKCYLYQKQIMY